MNNEWKTIKLLTINEDTDKNDPTKGWGMWVIQYVLNGESKAVKVVCGTWYTKDNEVRYSARGMGLRDFKALNPHWKEINALMLNPPAIIPDVLDALNNKDIEIPF